MDNTANEHKTEKRGHRKQKTASVQHLVGKQASSKSETEGPYMKTINQNVEIMAKSIQAAGKSIKVKWPKPAECDKGLKPAESDDESEENEIIPDTDIEDDGVCNWVHDQVDQIILNPDIFGSSPDEDKIEEPPAKKIMKTQVKERKTKQQKLDVFMKKREEVCTSKKFHTKGPKMKFSGLPKTAEPEK